MITIKTGKLFVEKYNEEMGTNLTPKEIFCMLAEKAFKGGRHMVNWTNTKFFQYLKDYNKFLEGKKEEPSFEDALNGFCDLVENYNCGLETTFNVYGGCAVPKDNRGEKNTTEFNYCDNIHFTIDERYCSFIGSFFQICVSGFSTVIDRKNIVWLLYESFNEYYDFIHNNEDVRDKQLPSWNGCYLYQKLKNQGIGWIENKKINKDGVGTINYLEFIEAIASTQELNVKNIIFENFGQTNTSAGYVTLDLDGLKNIYLIIERVLANIEEDFDIEKYSKLFLKSNLLRKSLEVGELTADMIDPLYDFKNRRREGKEDSKEYSNKDSVKFLKEYLKLIMSTEEIELSKNFGEFLKNVEGNGNRTLSVKEEVKNIFSSRNVTQLGEAIIKFSKKANLEYKTGTPFDVVSYFIQEGNSPKLQEFLMYTKFNM